MNRTMHRPRVMLTLVIVTAVTLIVAACGATPTPTPTLLPPTPTKAPAPPIATNAATATKPPAAPVATAVPALPTATKAPAATQPPVATTAAAASSVSFAKDILPIFQKNCIRCHGGSSPRSGMSLENYQGVMKGGASAPDVVAGNPDKSALYTYPKDGIMPPSGAKLSAADVQKIYDWIKAGAANN